MACKPCLLWQHIPLACTVESKRWLGMQQAQKWVAKHLVLDA